jgi:hypothetical protein
LFDLVLAGGLSAHAAMIEAGFRKPAAKATGDPSRRLRFERRKGFNLKALSRATNGLDVILVTRATRWGRLGTRAQPDCCCLARINAGQPVFSGS